MGAGERLADSTTAPRVLVVVPVYNHAGSLRSVVERALAVHPDVLVVDDGSTDAPIGALDGLNVMIVRHTANLGKGAAILTACREAAASGMTHILTIDADGQHDPAEIPKFLDRVTREPMTIFVGKRDFSAPNVPGAAKFGRAFGNFWLRVQTGHRIADIQSGYRLYPVAVLQGLTLRERRYAFEVEVLVKAAWAGVPLRDVDVSVYYAPGRERISHFRMARDNMRISHVNALLTLRSFLPWPHRQLVRAADGALSVVHPMRSVRSLLEHCADPREIAYGAAIGAVIAALPVLGFQGMITLFICGYFRLNRAAALLTNQLGTPPLIQAACIQIGYYFRFGRFLTEFSAETLWNQAPQRLYEWLLGSLIIGPALGALLGAAFYILAKSAKRYPAASE